MHVKAWLQCEGTWWDECPRDGIGPFQNNCRSVDSVLLRLWIFQALQVYCSSPPHSQTMSGWAIELAEHRSLVKLKVRTKENLTVLIMRHVLSASNKYSVIYNPPTNLSVICSLRLKKTHRGGAGSKLRSQIEWCYIECSANLCNKYTLVLLS